jgi:hypothetical protein
MRKANPKVLPGSSTFIAVKIVAQNLKQANFLDLSQLRIVLRHEHSLVVLGANLATGVNTEDIVG